MADSEDFTSKSSVPSHCASTLTQKTRKASKETTIELYNFEILKVRGRKQKNMIKTYDELDKFADAAR